jgi:hypothetical protein
MNMLSKTESFVCRATITSVDIPKVSRKGNLSVYQMWKTLCPGVWLRPTFESSCHSPCVDMCATVCCGLSEYGSGVGYMAKVLAVLHNQDVLPTWDFKQKG